MVTRMGMLKARDLMTRNVFTLPASLSASEAAWALMHRGVSGAPVHDAEGHLVGMLSNADLVDPERGGTDADGEWRTVGDIMTPAIIAVSEDASGTDAAQLMVEHGLHRVVVLDAAGGLAGIITPMDFLRRLLVEGRLVVESEREHAAEAGGSHPITHH